MVRMMRSLSRHQYYNQQEYYNQHQYYDQHEYTWGSAFLFLPPSLAHSSYIFGVCEDGR